MKIATPTTTDAPPATERAALPPAGGPAYVIEGRPGWRYASIEEACHVAADLVTRLKLNQRVKVCERGTGRVVAMAGRDGHGGTHVVRLTGAA